MRVKFEKPDGTYTLRDVHGDGGADPTGDELAAMGGDNKVYVLDDAGNWTEVA